MFSGGRRPLGENALESNVVVGAVRPERRKGRQREGRRAVAAISGAEQVEERRIFRDRKKLSVAWRPARRREAEGKNLDRCRGRAPCRCSCDCWPGIVATLPETGIPVADGLTAPSDAPGVFAFPPSSSGFVLPSVAIRKRSPMATSHAGDDRGPGGARQDRRSADGKGDRKSRTLRRTRTPIDRWEGCDAHHSILRRFVLACSALSCRACARAGEIPEPSGALRRQLRGRRLERHHRPRAVRVALGASRPAVHRGEPPGRQRQCRRRLGGEFAARRLHRDVRRAEQRDQRRRCSRSSRSTSCATPPRSPAS